MHRSCAVALRKRVPFQWKEPTIMTEQAYRISVPFSSTHLILGKSTGGPGASLTTLGNVLVDSKGTMGLQSAGAFSAQTKAGMQLLSQAGTQAHSQAKIEIFAGGGLAPGPCGSGGPAASSDTGTPGATAERIVQGATAVVSGAVAVFDGISAANEGNRLGVIKAGLDIAKSGVDAFGAASGGDFSSSTNVLGAASAGVSIGSSIADAINNRDIPSAIDAITSTLSSATDAVEPFVPGSTDIEERAADNIKLVAGRKISGTAALGVEFKTANKFSVSAAAAAEFTTIAFSVAAALKAEIKAIAKIAGKTFGKIEFDDSIGEWKNKAKLDLKAPTVTVDGKMVVTKNSYLQARLTVRQKTQLRDELEVFNKTHLKNELKVDKETQLMDKLTVKKHTKMEASASIMGNAFCKKNLTVNGKCRFG